MSSGQSTPTGKKEGGARPNDTYGYDMNYMLLPLGLPQVCPVRMSNRTPLEVPRRREMEVREMRWQIRVVRQPQVIGLLGHARQAARAGERGSRVKVGWGGGVF